MPHTRQSLYRSPGALFARRDKLFRNVLLGVAMTLTVAGAAQAQAYVNVTVGGAFAPGVYGQISLGNNAPPPVINVQPMIAGPLVYGAPTMYLHVAPEEYRDWGRYCNRYRACGHPVHFVRVEDNNRWWEHHNEHLRGEGYYRRMEDRHEERRGDYRRERREDRPDHGKDPRFEAQRGER